MAILDNLQRNFKNQQNNFVLAYIVKTLAISKNSINKGTITRQELGISQTAKIMFCTIEQYYNHTENTSITSDLAWGFNVIQNNPENVIEYKIYNASDIDKEIKLIFRVLTCES